MIETGVPYHVLARKYRPQQFSDVVGQAHVVQSLSHALSNHSVHHAYLFSGTRGVGKTTIARIFAKYLNCKNLEYRDSYPVSCNTCDCCIAIQNGCCPDFYEIDAASRTKVEDTRELLDHIPYAPTMGRYKIYLIDEVHMLSTHSFNALLKTLEEPPDHVRFLLATTDPQKLPATVLSRCLHFHLQSTSASEAALQIRHILMAEKKVFDEEAITLISHAANGSMRDALSLVDQSLALGSGALQLSETRTMLGMAEPARLFELLQAIHENNSATLLRIVEQLHQRGIVLSRVLTEFLSLLHTLCVAQALPEAVAEHPEASEILATSTMMSSSEIQGLYHIGIAGQRDFNIAPTPRIAFEMTFLHMLAKKTEATHNTSPMPAKMQAEMHKKTAKTTSLSPATPNTLTPQEWRAILPKLGLSGAAQALIQGCTFVQVDTDSVTLSATTKQKPLMLPRSITRINEALTEYFQRPMVVTIKI